MNNNVLEKFGDLGNHEEIGGRYNSIRYNILNGIRNQIKYSWCIIQIKSKKFPPIFKKIRENNKKVTEKRKFSLKTNSERSDECIDFTMIITSRNNAPISNYGGGFRCKSEYPWCIIEVKS
ncbi:Uncharacterized protein FWK35_00000742 [Aphis craccivora]|uniref:Uncharacterized protein n=1 Tax=Aphis craccivora TaxID=307492 RepID=A0A6G0ZE85_APHCR|nr:Uncharacterized protein FWK35_00000742 [Aphis craccivora]